MNVIEELNPPVSNTSLQVRSKKAIDDILIRRKSIEEKPFYLKKGHSLHKERGKEGLSIFIWKKNLKKSHALSDKTGRV